MGKRFGLLGSMVLAGCVATAPSEVLDGLDSPEDEDVTWEPVAELPDALEEWDGYADADDGPVSKCARGVHPSEVVPIDPSADPDTGQMRVKQGRQVVALPLAEVAFDTIVLGTVADTEVRQVFENPFDEPIEAVYVFPLPHDAAVDDYAIEIGDRTITGVMKTRADARAAYEKARSSGKRAGLLEQERPNIFTQSVANIPPGESITVVMHMVGPVEQDRGRFELALPTVVGPRFVPGTPTGRSGGGFSPDTDVVPDGSKITPKPLPPGYVSCAELSVTVEIDAGAPVDVLEAKHHAISRSGTGSQRFVTLAKDGELLNRDFVLGWSLATKAPTTSLMLAPKEDEGFFQLTVMPPRQEHAGPAAPRELVFVLDTSGSMGGQPLGIAKATMRGFLSQLGPNDSFQVIRFSEDASALGPVPLPNTPKNVRRGLDYVSGLQGGGGTMMIEGIKAALDYPPAPGRTRYVAFLTDGYIGNETEIFGAVLERLGESRLFSLGVGTSPNRYLLDGLAHFGRGAVIYTENMAAPRDAVGTFYRRLAHPVLTDLEIEWGDLRVEDVVPSQIPDLFTGQPVVVYGKLHGARSGTVTLVGRSGGERVEIPVQIDVAQAKRVDGLASMWARRRIQELEDSRITGGQDVERRVTEVALAHNVMTAYTSFVAIDDGEAVSEGGDPERVDVMVDNPVADRQIQQLLNPAAVPPSTSSAGGEASTTYEFDDDEMDAPLLSRGPLEDAPVVRKRAPRRSSRRTAAKKERKRSSVDEALVRRFDRLTKRNKRALRACFDTEGVSASKLMLDVSPSGKATLRSVSGSDAFESCLAAVIGSWTLRHDTGQTQTLILPLERP